MASSVLPRPGTKYGPCKGACEHRDCAATREMAAAICPHCGKPIGYGVAFFNLGTATSRLYAHTDCEYEAIDRERAAQR